MNPISTSTHDLSVGRCSNSVTLDVDSENSVQLVFMTSAQARQLAARLVAQANEVDAQARTRASAARVLGAFSNHS